MPESDQSSTEQHESSTTEAAPQSPGIPPELSEYVSSLRSEAAAHRTKARETAEALAASQERVTSMLRAEAERIATTVGFQHERTVSRPGGETGLQRVVLAQGADLWMGHDIDAVLGEDGNVDPAKVVQAVKDITRSRPGLAAAADFISATSGGMREQPQKSEVGLSALLGKRR